MYTRVVDIIVDNCYIIDRSYYIRRCGLPRNNHSARASKELTNYKLSCVLRKSVVSLQRLRTQTAADTNPASF